MKIIEAPDYQSMSRKAANLISAQVILFPRGVLGLGTGSTPLGIYQQLIDWYAKGDIDFSEVRSIDEMPRSAITLGIKAIMQAKKILLAVSGASKAEILERALYGPITPRVPASILQLHPDLTVVADQDALQVVKARLS